MTGAGSSERGSSKASGPIRFYEHLAFCGEKVGQIAVGVSIQRKAVEAYFPVSGGIAVQAQSAYFYLPQLLRGIGKLCISVEMHAAKQ
jgi:hypothetical protein